MEVGCPARLSLAIAAPGGSSDYSVHRCGATGATRSRTRPICESRCPSSRIIRISGRARRSSCRNGRVLGWGTMERNIAVIGAGLIGRAWAMVFARAGWNVRLHDRERAQLDAAQAFIAASLAEQAEYQLVADPAAAAARIETMPDLDAA